jgi:DNA-binding transcriptional LysR family regulator
MARFMVDHPHINIRLKSMNRRVDVISEGYDLAIRVSFPPLEHSGLVMRKLGISEQCLVASSKVLAELGTPTTLAELAALPSLDFGFPNAEHPSDGYAKSGTNGGWSTRMATSVLCRSARA